MAAYMIFLILNGLLAAPVSSTSATTSRVSTTMVTAGVRTGPAAPVVTKTTQEGDETVINVKSNTNVVLEKDGSISGTSSHSNVSVSGAGQNDTSMIGGFIPIRNGFNYTVNITGVKNDSAEMDRVPSTTPMSFRRDLQLNHLANASELNDNYKQLLSFTNATTTARPIKKELFINMSLTERNVTKTSNSSNNETVLGQKTVHVAAKGLAPSELDVDMHEHNNDSRSMDDERLFTRARNDATTTVVTTAKMTTARPLVTQGAGNASSVCGPNEELLSCARPPPCQPKCNGADLRCPMKWCWWGCQCKAGYYRDSSWKCVTKDECKFT